ncbi:MAG: thiosulfate oxidation carrier protein SoxY [Paracoccaceae bacterium]
MTITRRHVICASASVAAVGLVGQAKAQQHVVDLDAITAEQAEAEFVRGVEVFEGGVTIDLPDVVDDGYRVLVKLDAPGARELMLIAPGNPIPPILNVAFGPGSASHRVTSRMRLGQSQTVIALARMPNGTVRRTTRDVQVLVGGCG